MSASTSTEQTTDFSAVRCALTRHAAVMLAQRIELIGRYECDGLRIVVVLRYLSIAGAD